MPSKAKPSRGTGVGAPHAKITQIRQQADTALANARAATSAACADRDPALAAAGQARHHADTEISRAPPAQPPPRPQHDHPRAAATPPRHAPPPPRAAPPPAAPALPD